MKLLLAVACLVLVLVLVPVQWENRCVSGSESISCREDERSALLQINAILPVPIRSSDGKWEGKECCRWERVTCDPITGHVTKEIIGLPSLSLSLDFSYNYLTGILPSEIGNLKNLQSIRLSNNKLHGEIPSTIDGCQELEALYLDGNMFQGTFPTSLGNLRSMQHLDVSNNLLSGRVLEFLGIMNLHYLDSSFNNFEGELPERHFQECQWSRCKRKSQALWWSTSNAFVPVHLSISQPSTQNHHTRRKMVLISYVVGSFICITSVIRLLVIYYTRNNPRNNPHSDRALKYGLTRVSYNDLLRATENFSPNNLMGRGTFGEVYKTVMSFENVPIVAVKVLNLEKHSASRSFFDECEALKNMRHRNLLKVLSLCSSIDHQGNDFKDLVFEFMRNGILETWLHPNACTDRPFRSLSFIQRLNIACDVAAALDYLHYHVPAPIVHCDLKPSNVHLDDDMTAHVSDFGLARFLVRPDTMSSQSMSTTGGVKGSIGYIPPEITDQLII